MISIVRNEIIILEPQNCPTTWKDPDTGISWSGFNNFSIAELDALGRKDIVDEPLSYDSVYESLSISGWQYDSELDIVTRNYAKIDRPLETVRAERLAAVRAACSNGILAVIDIFQQMNLANGIIPDLGYTDWIADMIAESNRCEDLYIAAVDMAGLKAVVWNFPTYVTP